MLLRRLILPAVCCLPLLLGGCCCGLSQPRAIALAERGAKENKPFLWNPREGMLGVRFGMTKKEVESILGSSSGKFGDKGWQYHRLGFALAFDEQGKVLDFMAGSNGCDPTQCLTRAFKGVTDKGIKMGSTEADVIRAYGSPSKKETFAAEDRVELRYRRDDKSLGIHERFGFTLRKGKVSQLYAVVGKDKL